MGLNVDSFGDILAHREAKSADDTVVLGLVETIRRYAEFHEFGQLMHEKFLELYALPHVTGESALHDGAHACGADPMMTLAKPSTSESNHGADLQMAVNAQVCGIAGLGPTASDFPFVVFSDECSI